MLKIGIVTLLLSLQSIASECPWIGQDAQILLAFDSDNSYEKKLSRKQVQQDLDCLNLIIKNKYSGTLYFKEINLSQRIEKAVEFAENSTTTGLLDIINGIHEGIIDRHLSYSIHGGTKLDFSKENKIAVELKQVYPDETIIETEKYTYFKPGELDNAISKGQQNFLDYIKHNDKNLVIDLRGNGGGTHQFVKPLVESLFTGNKHIPATEMVQINSIFQYSGMCITYFMLGMNGYEEFRKFAEDFCNQARSALEGQVIADYESYSLSRADQKWSGRRATEFTSKIMLLTDGGCASGCETIVEKLSVLKNTIVIGENTNGALHFSNAMTLMLPNSGIIVSIPTLFHKYENDAPEDEGYEPMIRQNYIDLDLL